MNGDAGWYPRLLGCHSARSCREPSGCAGEVKRPFMPVSALLIWDMRVIWTYRRLAFDVLAELPLSLTGAAVDPFPKHVGVAAVAGVLLNHVDQYRAQRRATAVRLEALDA